MFLARPVRLVAPALLLGLPLLVGAHALHTRTRPTCVERVAEVAPRHALALEIVNSETACHYYSSFDEHPVVVDATDSHLELQRTFEFEDGCTWRSFETLDRVQASAQFTYTYREAPLSCPADVTPAVACRRVGFANEVP